MPCPLWSFGAPHPPQIAKVANRHCQPHTHCDARMPRDYALKPWTESSSDLDSESGTLRKGQEGLVRNPNIASGVARRFLMMPPEGVCPRHTPPRAPAVLQQHGPLPGGAFHLIIVANDKHRVPSRLITIHFDILIFLPRPTVVIWLPGVRFACSVDKRITRSQCCFYIAKRIAVCLVYTICVEVSNLQARGRIGRAPMSINIAV
jgi:hypothetical protein